MRPLVAARARTLLEARASSHRDLQSLRAHLTDVVELNRGHTGFVTPTHIREAAKRAIDDGHTHYEEVVPLREAIAAKLWRDNGMAVDPRTEIVVTAGTKLMLFDLMQAFVEPGDEVISARPELTSYFGDHVVFNQGTPVFVPLRSERRFKLDPADVGRAITPRTKIIGLTTPDAPTGAVQERRDLEAIAAFAQRHDLLVIADELYEKINFGPTAHTSIAALDGMRERTITVNGVSKCYAMTGWRVGYAAGPARLMTAVAAIDAANSTWPSVPAQYAALAALTGPQDLVTDMVTEYHRRMDLLVGGLNAMPGITCHFPEGAYYGWPNISAFGLSSMEFARFCLREERVAVGPGEAFGPEGAGHVRVSCSGTEEEIQEGLRRLARAREKLPAAGRR